MYFYKVNDQIIPSATPLAEGEALTPNTTDGAYEKHVPVIEQHGDHVTVNQPLMIVEAMKMETTFVSNVNGTIDKIYAAPGERVNTEDLLISFVLDEEEEK